MQRIALGQFKYVHVWHDHLLDISDCALLVRIRGRALESGQMRRLEVLVVELSVVLGQSQSTLGAGASVVMMGPLDLGARHMVHLMADSQFS